VQSILPEYTNHHVFLDELNGSPQGRAEGFTWANYQDLIIATHHNLSAPVI
jgi:hypothetical protein